MILPLILNLGGPAPVGPSIDPALLLLLDDDPSAAATIDVGLLLLLDDDDGGGVIVDPDRAETFRQAVVEWIAEHLPELTGGLWPDLADDETVDGPVEMPFGVYEEGAGTGFEFSTESPYIQSGSISISIYATSQPQARDLAAGFRAVIKDAPLRFNEGRLMYLRVGRTIRATRENESGPAGATVYRALLMLDYAYVTIG